MAFFCPLFNKSYQRDVTSDDEGTSTQSGKFLTSAVSLGALDSKELQLGRNDDRYISGASATVLANFAATVQDELTVSQGDVVIIVYRDGDWIFVQNAVGKEGFIPLAFCSPVISQKNQTAHISGKNRVMKKLFRSLKQNGNSMEGKNLDQGTLSRKKSKSQEANLSQLHNNEFGSVNVLHSTSIKHVKATKRKERTFDTGIENLNRFLQSLEHDTPRQDQADFNEMPVDVGNLLAPYGVDTGANSTTAGDDPVNVNGFSSSSSVDVEENFTLVPQGMYIAMHDYIAQYPDDLLVRKGDILVLMNNDDIDWYWMQAHNCSAQGFVPSSYVRPLVLDEESKESGAATTNGVELLVAQDVVPIARDDLAVQRGDWIVITSQLTDEQGSAKPNTSEINARESWLWAFCPRTQKYGFVPRSHLVLPSAAVADV